ncbi:MAG: DHHA1 domain-containing protein [Nanoarchaeota archaeon]
MNSCYKDIAELMVEVKSIDEKHGHLSVVFDDTIFYPGGGGQPCDTGIIISESFEGEVVLVDENEEIWHKVKPITGHLKVGDKVLLRLNVPRRASLLRMHTGEHIFFKSLQYIIPDARLDKINLSEDESKLFIIAEKLSWKEIFEAETLANKIISEGREITETEYDKEDVLKIEGLRIKPERIPGNKVRVIRVDDFDLSACRGVHAHNTGIVGNILITGFSKTGKGAELRFKTNISQELFSYAALLRESASILGTNVSQVPEFIRKLQQEVSGHKIKFREAAGKLALHATSEEINGKFFVWNITESLDNKQLSEAALKLCKERCVVLLVNRGEANNAIISTSADSGIDASKTLLHALNEFGGKGGGRERLAAGSFSGSVDKFVMIIKELIKSS